MEKNPKEYFNVIKAMRKKSTKTEVKMYYNTCIAKLNDFIETKQVIACKKLMNEIESSEKEIQAIDKGIDTYVFREDITEYIQEVTKKRVKIIELERYERAIPKDVRNEYNKVKDIFDAFYVVFTDYTGKETQKALKDREQYDIEKDPILFGSFKKDNYSSDKFYFIGDWIDEYCDLTLSKMIREMSTTKDVNIEHTLSLDDYKKAISKIEEESRKLLEPKPRVAVVKKRGIFEKIKSFFK